MIRELQFEDSPAFVIQRIEGSGNAFWIKKKKQSTSLATQQPYRSFYLYSSLQITAAKIACSFLM